ncbi:MAG: hypothetical protein HYT90_05840 [Candidatus Omnitrophica bacterium]|nr:hypothetical protein [Candidatus Omnitrophota bacterium]
MEFLRRTVRLIAWSSLFLVPGTAAVWGPRAAVGVAGGMSWAVANAWALSGLVHASLGEARSPWWARAGLWILKVPLLYAVGAVLAVSPWSSPVGFLAGFSLWFVGLVASALREAAA